MRKIYLFILLAIGTPTFAMASLIVVTEDLWPFNFVENNKVTGPHTHLVKALLNSEKLEYTLTSMPWARSYQLAKTQPNVLIYTINHTQARHDQFHWIGEFPSQAHINYYALNTKFSKLSETQFKSLRIGTQIGTANDAFVTQQGFKNISRVTHIKQTLGMLTKKRIDVVIASPKQIVNTAIEMGLKSSELIMIGHAFSSRPSMALSLSTPKETVIRLQNAFKKLTKQSNLCELMKLSKTECLTLAPKAQP